MRRLHGRTCIVRRGIRRAGCQRLREERPGAALTDIAGGNGNHLRAGIVAQPGIAACRKRDVAEAAAVDAVSRAIATWLGRIDVLATGRGRAVSGGCVAG